MTSITPYSTSNITLFTPDQISALTLWLDAADSSTIQLSGANVTQWNDKSGYGYNCISNSNYVGTSLPTYSNLTSQKYVNFADNQALVTSNNWNYSSAWSCFVALNSVVLGARWLISPFNGVSLVNFISNPCVISAIYNTTNSVALLNGTQYSSGNVGTGSLATGLTLGSRYTVTESWDGHMCEMIYYNSVLTEQQRQQIEGYLAWKWNTQRSLATNHKFYNFPPG